MRGRDPDGGWDDEKERRSEAAPTMTDDEPEAVEPLTEQEIRRVWTVHRKWWRDRATRAEAQAERLAEGLEALANGLETIMPFAKDGMDFSLARTLVDQARQALSAYNQRTET